MARNSQVAQVVLLDVGGHMHSHLDTVSRALAGYLVSKMHSSPRHKVALVLYGTTETRNAVQDAVGDSSQYCSITEAWPLKPPDKDEIRQLAGLPRGQGRSDLCDALVVAVDVLRRAKEDPLNKSMISSILVISSFRAEPVDVDASLARFVSGIASQMISQGTSLDALCLQLDEDGKPHGSLAALDNLLAELGAGSVRTVKSNAELLSCFRGKEVAPTTIYRGPLDFSSEFNIPVWVYKKTSELKLPSMKRYSDQISADHATATHDVIVDTEYKSTTDPDKKVAPEDRVKAYQYGKQYVPMDDMQEGYLKFTADKSFRVLGFVPREQAPHHQYMQDTNVVVPEPNNEKASKALSALVQAMQMTDPEEHPTGRVAIARASWRQNSTTVLLGVLSPHPGGLQHADSLLFNVLPYHEESRNYFFPSFDSGTSKHYPVRAQRDAAATLIENMSLDGDNEEILKPEATINPTIAFFNGALAERLIEGEAASGGPELTMLLQPPKHFQSIPALKQAGQVLAERLSTRSKLSTGISQSLGEKAPALAGSIKMELDELQEAQPTDVPSLAKVGALTPLQDFQKMLENPASRERALESMQAAVISLVDESIGNRHHKTALECLQALRKECVRLGAAQSNQFNNFLSVLKSKFQDDAAHSEFWQLVLNTELSLITAMEVPGCSANKDDADALLKPRAAKEQMNAGVPATTAVDEDDEFDDMD